MLKFIVDVAHDEGQERGSLGIIARDAVRKFIPTGCKEIDFVADALMAEAYAFREGLSLAQYLNITISLSVGYFCCPAAAIFDDCRILQ
jgi:uncharacterized protein (DUF697 family)